MKRAIRKVTFLLALVLVFASMVVPAYAVEPRDNQDKPYKFEVVPTSGFAHTAGRVKETDSKLFTRVDTMKDKFVRVAAFSMDTSEGIPINLTYYGSGLAPYVKCKRGINYGIGSVIYEYHQRLPYTYGNIGALGFQSALGYSDAISGLWSVDSTGSHSVPDAP